MRRWGCCEAVVCFCKKFSILSSYFPSWCWERGREEGGGEERMEGVGVGEGVGEGVEGEVRVVVEVEVEVEVGVFFFCCCC